MELRQAEFFVAIIECGSVTRAAERLHISQPSLSQAIRVLEQQRGVALFDRVGRRLAPSDAGLSLLPFARRLLADAAAAHKAVRDVAELAGGSLRIAVHAELIVDPLAPLIGRFRQAHPEVQIDLVDPHSNSAAIRLVQDNSCDVAITDAPAGARSLACVRLGVQEIFLAAAEFFPLPAGDPVHLRDLATVPLVLTPLMTSGRALIDAAFASVGTSPNAMVECAPREAIWALTLGGAGASFFLPVMAEAARAQGAQVRSTLPAITREVFVVYREQAPAPALAEFLKVVDGADPYPPAR